MGEVHLREGVRQGAVGAASPGDAGCVVVAAYDDGGDPVLSDRGEGSLGDPERAVMRGRVVEDVAQPDDEVRFLGQAPGLRLPRRISQSPTRAG